jgi:hypothetical protein
MMPAHFLYARFPARSHRPAADWMRAVDDAAAMHRDRYRVAPCEGGPGDAVSGWRLLTENHRELGRGTRFAVSEAAIRDDIHRIVRAADGLIVWATPETGLRTTGWFAVLDDEIVMIGARRYENRSVARNAGALAVRLLQAMRVTEDGAAARSAADEYVP